MGARKEMRKAGLFFFNEKKEKDKKKAKPLLWSFGISHDLKYEFRVRNNN